MRGHYYVPPSLSYIKQEFGNGWAEKMDTRVEAISLWKLPLEREVDAGSLDMCPLDYL